MATFTITLPEGLLWHWRKKTNALSVARNKLVENALRLYLEHLDRVEYINSYKIASEDENILSIGEVGMKDFLNQQEK